MITGKGIYIWKIKECEGGNISNIVNLCKNANFSHVLIKIADGKDGYNHTMEDGDMAKALADALKVAGIEPWGWQYIYGVDPAGEAEVANRRIEETGVGGFVINAEQQIRDIADNELVVERYFNELNADMPWGLSSYRYPEVHPTFPWDTFIAWLVEEDDFIMPQVYWMEASKPGEQLVECVNQDRKFTEFSIIPTGSAFAEHGCSPTNAEIVEFADKAKELELPAINFWELGVTKRQGYWKTVRDIEYEVVSPVVPPVPPVVPPVGDCATVTYVDKVNNDLLKEIDANVKEIEELWNELDEQNNLMLVARTGIKDNASKIDSQRFTQNKLVMEQQANIDKIAEHENNIESITSNILKCQNDIAKVRADTAECLLETVEDVMAVEERLKDMCGDACNTAQEIEDLSDKIDGLEGGHNHPKIMRWLGLVK